MDEVFDILDEDGKPTGQTKHRKLVHKDGDWHRAVHVWLYVMETQELLIQKRAPFKDSWAGLWDISAAGHVSTGETSVGTALRETFEELGVTFPKEAFEPLFTHKLASTDHGGAFVNNEFDDVYLVTVKSRIPEAAFVLDEAEVDAVKYVPMRELRRRFLEGDATLVPADVSGGYGKLFDILEGRVKAGGLPGSGITTFFHKLRGRQPIQVQCLTFDDAYLQLIPPEHR